MRIHGHRAARIDPLDLIHREEVAALNPHRYGLGLTHEGLNEKYNVDGIVWTKRVGESDGQELWTLEDIVKSLRGVYVGNIGYEFMHSPSKTERLWFSHLLESQSLPSPEDHPLSVIDESRKRRIHELLARSEVFDNFLQAKFPNLKRVSRRLIGPFYVSHTLDSTALKEESQCYLLWTLYSAQQP